MSLQKARELQKKIADATSKLNSLLIEAARAGYKTEADVDTFETNVLGAPVMKYPIINTALYVNPNEVNENE